MIKTSDFNAIKEHLKMAIKIRFRGLQKELPKILENPDKIKDLKNLAWWPSNLRYEFADNWMYLYAWTGMVHVIV